MARNILEQNREELQGVLLKKVSMATFVVPVFDMGSVTCHVNVDEMLKAAYLGFDELYAIPLTERVSKKQDQFKGLAKIRVIGI